MEHEQALPQITADPHHDPGDFVAEEKRIQKAKPNYIGVFVVLGVLTAIEIAITTIFHNTAGRVPVLLFLTVAKGLLVILYYMHLKFDSRVYSFFFGAGVLAFAVPFVLSMIFLISPPSLQSARGEGGGEGGEQRPTPNPNAGPPLTFVTEGGEFYFRPDSVNPNTGQVVRVTLNNVGSVEHTFVVASQPKAQLPEPWVTNDGKLIARAAPGASGRGSFTAPAPGEWVFYCNVPGHAQAGMIGTMIVQ
jgi:cytochrome c oxidase subunit 4